MARKATGERRESVRVRRGGTGLDADAVAVEDVVVDSVEQERDDLRGALHLGLDRDDRGAADDRVVVDEALRYPHDRIRERADVGPRLERAALLLLAIQLGELSNCAAMHAAIA